MLGFSSFFFCNMEANSSADCSSKCKSLTRSFNLGKTEKNYQSISDGINCSSSLVVSELASHRFVPAQQILKHSLECASSQDRWDIWMLQVSFGFHIEPFYINKAEVAVIHIICWFSSNHWHTKLELCILSLKL